MKRESPVKKHHFWILLGLVPLFTLISVVMISSKVGGEIEKRQKTIADANKEIAGKTNPKPDELLRELDKVANEVGKKQGTLHKDNWDRQKSLFTWPGSTRPGVSRVFNELEQKNLKFGETIPDLTAVFGEFQRVETYQHEYSALTLRKDGTIAGNPTGMADLMAPTQFANNDWRTVLRYVNDFGQVNITKDQVWLLLEDMWIQRSLLAGLRSVNTEMGTFERVKYEKPEVGVIDDPASKTQNNKTKRLFRSRTWELALELVPAGPNSTSKRLTGTLTNISDRLQLLGTGNVMTVNVWLSPDPKAQPVPFRIGGEYLPGKGSKKTVQNKVVDANVLDIVQIDDHIVPPSSFDEGKLELARVEQVFDVRTVPLKRIDFLVLGEQGMDARSKGQPIRTPRSTADTPPGLFSEAFTKDPASDPMGPMGPMGPIGLPPIGPPMGGPGVGGKGKFGGGSLVDVVDGNKRRYLAATEQVRRMPVGLVVIVDQASMQDVLLALSNSPLRFQITQVSWTRFRGELAPPGSPSGPSGLGSPSGPGGGIGVVGGGSIGGSFGRPDPDDRGPRLPAPRPPVGPMGVGVGPGPGTPTGPGGYPGVGIPAVSDSQITSGLVELSVYGIVSLYERYEEAPTGPKPPGPGPPVPVPMGPNPPMPPKMRRRRRA